MTAENKTHTEDESSVGNQLFTDNLPNNMWNFSQVSWKREPHCEGFRGYGSFMLRLKESGEVGQMKIGKKII